MPQTVVEVVHGVVEVVHGVVAVALQEAEAQVQFNQRILFPLISSSDGDIFVRITFKCNYRSFTFAFSFAVRIKIT